jgi:hypothetical protein
MQSSLKSPFFIKSDFLLANTLCNAASSIDPNYTGFNSIDCIIVANFFKDILYNLDSSSDLTLYCPIKAESNSLFIL